MKSGVSNFVRKFRWEIAIVVLAIVLRLVYLWASIHAVGGDVVGAICGSDGYYTVSQNLIAGNGFSQDTAPPYTPYSFRPPLYFFFLTGAQYLAQGLIGAVLLQILIGSLLSLIGMKLVSYLLESRKLQLAVGFALAVEPSAILYSDMFYSEIFFMLLLFSSLWAFFAYLKHRNISYIACSALLIGLATLTRPAAQFVPLIAVAVVLWESRKHLSKSVVVALCTYVGVFLLVLAPWVYRNYSTFGVVGISPQTGVNLYTQLLPTLYSIDNKTPFQSEFNKIMGQGVRGPNLAYITDGAPYAKTAIPLILEHPKALVLSALNSGWSFFVLDGVFDFLRHVKIRPAQMLGKPSLMALFSDPAGFISYFAHNLFGPLAVILLGRVFWVIIMFAFFFGAWRYLRTYGARPAAVLVLALILYMAATACIVGFGITARYRLPVNVFVLTFAFYEIAAVAPKLRRVFKLPHA